MSQLELKKIKGNTYYIPSPANIGIYAENGNAILIDSGNDKEAGRQICKLIDSAGWKISSIINTHSNADHTGGNAFIQQKTGCRIAATKIEAAFIENPILEPAFLFGGFPHNGIKNKFLMAQASKVTDFLNPGEFFPDTSLEIIDLPGHFFGMIGVKTQDNIIFLADSLFSKNIVDKYGIFYLLDIENHLKTLENLKTLKANYYVPSHAELLSDITELIAVNRKKIDEICSCIVNICTTGIEIDNIFAEICSKYKIELNDNQYVLIGNCLKAYLVYLVQKEIILKEYKEGRLFFKKI